MERLLARPPCQWRTPAIEPIVEGGPKRTLPMARSGSPGHTRTAAAAPRPARRPVPRAVSGGPTGGPHPDCGVGAGVRPLPPAGS